VVAFSIGEDHENLNITTTDKNGLFVLDQIPVYGSQQVTIRSRNENAWRPGRDNVLIDFNPQFGHLPLKYERLPQVRYTALEAPDDPELFSDRVETVQTIIDNYLQANMFGELEEVTVTAERVRTGMFMDRDRRSSQSIDLEARPILQNMPLWLVLNQIPGVTASWSSISINTGSVNLGGTAMGGPLLFVDGVETTYDYITMLSSNEISTINVYRRAYELTLWGSRGNGGVLEISTRSGLGLESISGMRPGLLTGFIQGYQVPVSFYSPRYGVRSTRTPDGSDARVTLHWDPAVNIGNTEQILRFWTNDYTSNYRVVLEGITTNGIPFRRTVRFEVE
jgi:hypothetical protein